MADIANAEVQQLIPKLSELQLLEVCDGLGLKLTRPKSNRRKALKFLLERYLASEEVENLDDDGLAIYNKLANDLRELLHAARDKKEDKKISENGCLDLSLSAKVYPLESTVVDVEGTCSRGENKVRSPSKENDRSPPSADNDGDKKDSDALLYAIDETPPIGLSFLLGFQHFLTMFGSTVGIPFILGRAMCIIDKPTVVSEILSTLIFCSGIVTLLQSTFGVRLPIVQGGAFALIPPALAIMETRNSIITCAQADNATLINGDLNDPEWQIRMRMVQGAILVASCFQVGIGLSGVVGLLLKFIGPLTIVPTITLVALPLFEVAGYYNGSQWGVALLTMVCLTLFSQVLERFNLRLCKGITVPVFKLFPVLLSILIGWILSGILTATGALEKGSAARTDYRSMVLEDALWFRIPYPGQWGTPTVTVAAVFGMLAGILASMIESIGDYYAIARLAGAPPPPVHALNRGIAFEGLGCIITGAMGTGNGTTSYSENIGAIGITRVGSIRVIQCGCLIMIVLSVIGKFGAVFATIPNPVIGAVLTIMFGLITAVGLSALQFVDLSSMRNIFVLGVSIFFGFVVPEWVKKNAEAFDVGDAIGSQIIVVLLSVNMFVGGMIGFILDNLLPGTKEERGIIAWNSRSSEDGKSGQPIASVHVYDPPFLTSKFMQSKVCKFLPFLPYYPLPPTPATEAE